MHTHRTGVLRLEESLSLALFCYLITLTEADYNRDFAIFTAYRSINQFPVTIETCSVYLLSVEFDI